MASETPDTAAALAGKTVFVTGGTGFLGSHLVEGLLKAGAASVRCLVRTERKWLNGLPVEIVAGDLLDRPALERGVRGADVVFHVAALTRARTWAAFERANVTGTTRLLDTIAEANPTLDRIVLTSSLAVVGRSDTAIADENTPLDPVSMELVSEDFRAQAERAFIVQKLREHDWNVAETARRIDMPRSNLYKKIEKYGLVREG